MEPPPLPFMRDLVGVASDAEKFRSVVEVFRELTSSGVPWSACEKLAEGMGASASDAFGILQAANFLYEQTRGWGKSWQPRLAEFLRILPMGLGIEPTDPATVRITELCEPIEGRERARQREWLRHGLLQNAVSFASFLDLRPAYSEKKDAIAELVPVVLFAVNVDDGDTIVFQLTVESVSALRTVVAEIERKLATVRENPALSQILAPTEDTTDGE